MEERKTVGQRVLDLVGVLLRGLGVAVGWFLMEVETTLRLFSAAPPMFFELALAIVFLLAYHFPGEDTKKLVAFAGTELAIPFVLGLFYSVLNMVWVAIHQERSFRWCYTLAKASIFPTALAWAIFSNRTFQQFIGWGDPASTLRFCVWLVWGVVVANVIVVQTKAKFKK